MPRAGGEPTRPLGRFTTPSPRKWGDTPQLYAPNWTAAPQPGPATRPKQGPFPLLAAARSPAACAPNIRGKQLAESFLGNGTLGIRLPR